MKVPAMTPGMSLMMTGIISVATRSERRPVHPQHIGVERHLDDDERRIQEAILTGTAAPGAP